MRSLRSLRRALALTSALVVVSALVPAVGLAAVPYGFLGNSQPCAAPANGVPLYKAEWRGQWGYYGLEAVPTNYGGTVTNRLLAGEVVLTAPTVMNQEFVRVIHDLQFWFVRRGDLCVANVGVDASAAALAGGKRIPDLRVHGALDPVKYALAIRHLSNIPAHVQEAVDSRGGYGTLFQTTNITTVPGYEAWKEFPLMGPYATGRTTEDLHGLSIGPNVNAGFGASVAYESDTESTAVHEFAHVYDYATGRSLTGDFLFGPQVEAQTCAVKMNPYNASYFTGNPIEWYAESFQHYVISEARNADLKRLCPQTWAYHRGTLGVPAY